MILYMVALISLLLGCTGLVLELGIMQLTQSRMQTAADAAAIGAVYALQDGSPMVAGGAADATLNGFTSGTNNVQVSISTPPASGSYIGDSFATQATITQAFSSVFLPGSFSLSAQATSFLPATPCVYLLSQYSTAPSLNAINETIQTTCPFYIGQSYYFNGGSSSSGGQYFINGGAANGAGSVSPTPIFGAPIMYDPLGTLSEPQTSSCDHVNMSITSAATLQPGTYCGGLNITTSQAVTLNPGVYIVAGNLTINGPTLTGNGITFYMTQTGGYTYGTTILENINATLSAPTNGVLQGILFFVDRALPAGQSGLSLANWNPSSITDGILYLVGQQLSISNIQLKPNNYLGIVADNLSIHNTGFYPGADYASLAAGNPFHPIGGWLVE